ncbi:MAG TPA: OB-fold nucleic acid binding domain-containing protein [Acidimicrobiales bacterium]|nr:OB-fold nucleic acid binding domain-containing protein [Acidimicrobiales bacterium]
MALKKAFKRLTTPVAELDRDRLRQFCAQVEGATPIAECQPRRECTVVGEISTVRIVPRPDGSPWLEATVKDGTGSLVVMWTGRTSIAGVAAGRRLTVTGRGAPKGKGGRLLVINPRYQLLA